MNAALKRWIAGASRLGALRTIEHDHPDSHARLMSILTLQRQQYCDWQAGTFKPRAFGKRVTELQRQAADIPLAIEQFLASHKMLPEDQKPFRVLAKEQAAKGIAGATVNASYVLAEWEAPAARGGAPGSASDESLVEKGRLRGWQIRVLNRIYPKVSRRNVQIAELLRHIGFDDTTDDHVSSIITQRERTSKK